jgi:hypothetical protein
MTPARTAAAQRNLRRGIKKMEKVMTKAAQVRRDFRLGRPPKPSESLPLHRAIVWKRATDALANFRERMRAAGLDPNHAKAAIVYVMEKDPTKPHFLLLESDSRPVEECQVAAYRKLGGNDVLAIGMIFDQYDAESGQTTTFPHQFTGLSAEAMEVLKEAARAEQQLIAQSKVAN